jgi:predicted enzyme related to lactoylglutathione lyase
MVNNLCYFELMVSDTDKARNFYMKVFDWKLKKSAAFPDYYSVDTGQAPEGGLMKKPAQAPHHTISPYFLVDSADDTLKKAEAAGGKIGVPRTEIPGIGWWALFFDPDEIPIMIFEPLQK